MLQHERVSCVGKIQTSADRVWSLVRDFGGKWHPAIHQMELEYDKSGRLVRTFTVHGEDTCYRERLTWFSNSERSFEYTHLSGIEGAQQYRAKLSVSVESETECLVSMSAELSAESPRSAQIATGTKAIFEHAINTIRALTEGSQSIESKETLDEETLPSAFGFPKATTQIISGSPSLVVSRTDGPREDIVCLFLHGIGGSKDNWQMQLMAVAPYCTAVSLDLRGYGESNLGEHQSSADDHCNDILRVMDHLNAKKLILCGLSFGAWIATSFAVRHPDRLSGLVLSGGCTGMSEASAQERDAFRKSREVPLSQGQTPADFAPDVIDILSGPDCSKDVKDQLLSSMQAISSNTYADALRCFTQPKEQFDFSTLTMPVLLMTGDSDKLAPPHEIKQVAKRIHKAAPQPDVRFESLERTGHVCNLEAPVAYNTALVSLVRRLTQ